MTSQGIQYVKPPLPPLKTLVFEEFSNAPWHMFVGKANVILTFFGVSKPTPK